jgi:hypothetical protein
MQGQEPTLPTPPAPPAPPFPGEPVIVQTPFQSQPPWITLPPQVTLLITLGFFAACTVVLYPLMRALARRLEGKPGGTDPALRSEIDQMRHRLDEIEAVHGRVLDLEERVDFAERLLAQRREGERLPGG